MWIRDYSLLGPDAGRAVAEGLVTPNWYRTPIPRARMKELMRRSDQPALRDTIILFGLMIMFAGSAITLMPSWWSAPFWLAYGVLYGSAMDSRWHECGHGTAFKTRWMNRFVYQIASFCMIRDPNCWKFSHSRHHSDTIIVGRDPEVAIMRPVVVARMIANLFGIIDTWDGLRRMLVHASGRMAPDEETYVEPAFYSSTFKNRPFMAGDLHRHVRNSTRLQIMDTLVVDRFAKALRLLAHGDVRMAATWWPR